MRTISYLVDLVLVAAFILGLAFLFLAYQHPDTLSQIVCHMRSDTTIEYTFCRIQTSPNQ